jgi:hypothetical protein
MGSMVENPETFALKILFDPEQTSREKLEEQATGLLHEYLAQVRLEVGETTAGHLLLSIVGPLEGVDACHREIVDTLIKRFGRHHFRLIDEAGDEIRKQAYPILAKIEQELRAFVNQSIVEVLGFEWWTSLGEVEIPGIDAAKSELYKTHHPLECAQFDDLLEIVTTEVAQWRADRPLSQADLLELLAEAETIEEVKENLKRKGEAFSFWDNVFARYFEDEQKWKRIRKELGFIIGVRHKVMHHRPIHYGELEELKRKKEELIGLLASARSRLSDQERVEIQQSVGDLREVYATMIQSVAEEEVYNRLVYALFEASDSKRVTQSLDEADSLQRKGRLSTKEAYELRAQAFRRLQQLTTDDPSKAEILILDRLLPYTLVADPEAGVALYQLRGCLVDWMEQYPGPVHHDLRDKVLERIYPHLRSSDPVAACWLVSRIGYRTDEAAEALQEIIARNDDDLGDTALDTLIRLGVPHNQRESILSQLHERAASRYNHSLVSALAQLADPASLRVVYEQWLTSDQYELSRGSTSLIFNVFRSVLNIKEDDPGLQDRTWQQLADLAKERPDEYAHEFYLGRTVPYCNSALVVPTMLEWLGGEAWGRGDSAWGRYLIGVRLEECVRPRQLAGWKRVEAAPAFDLLKHDAGQNTGSDGFWTTQEDMVKTKAWETMLRAGNTDALNWFDEAVLPEESRFMQQKVTEWFALFRFESLPEIIIQWITEDYDRASAGQDSREFMRRMAATRMARSSASRGAFAALLDFGLTSEGKCMVQSSDALAEVALHLIREGEVSVLDELVDTAIDCKQAHQRVAAAYTLDRLASRFSELLLKHAERLVPALYETEREHYERGMLINVLGQLQDWHVSDDLLQDLKDWARESEGWVQGSSLTALVNHDYLHECHDLLEEVLQLQKVEDGWDLVPDVERHKEAPRIIGLLYHRHLDTFRPAVTSLIQSLHWLHMPPVIEILRYSHGKPDQPALPKTVEDALIQRSYEAQSMVSSETAAFQVLAESAPTRLVEERWEDVWDNWHPNSRVALADALAEAKLEPTVYNRAVSLLLSLAGDSQFAVRRSAYRGLAQRSMDALHRLCLSWSISPSAEMRQRAAEACGWLDQVISEDGSDASEQLYQDLVVDCERSVREAAEHTWTERSRRLWAAQYLSIVIGVKGQTNEEILNAWRYGDALARIGDDSCIRALRAHLWGSLPPNVRFWIQGIVEKMEENWRKITKEWPAPWFSWEGAVVEGTGRTRILGKQWNQVSYSLWLQPRSALTEEHRIDRWGGAMWPISMPLSFELLERNDDGIVELELENGWQGKILIEQVDKGTAYFLGQSPSPLLPD